MISLIPLQIPKNYVTPKSSNVFESILRDAAKMPIRKDTINPACLEPDYEYTWDRVQRMRKEKHPLMSGGKQS